MVKMLRARTVPIFHLKLLEGGSVREGRKSTLPVRTSDGELHVDSYLTPRCVILKGVCISDNTWVCFRPAGLVSHTI